MQALQSLLGLIVLLVGIAPVAMAGGRMIAAFMMGRGIGSASLVAVLALLLLVGGALLSLGVVMPALSASIWLGQIASALLIALPPWLVWWYGQRWMDQRGEQ